MTRIDGVTNELHLFLAVYNPMEWHADGVTNELHLF